MFLSFPFHSSHSHSHLSYVYIPTPYTKVTTVYTCNRISMTVATNDLTTCHPLYQFAAAGDYGFTYVKQAFIRVLA